MKWEIVFEVKDYVRNWSDQVIDTNYKNVSAHIEIKNLTCQMCLVGDGNVEEIFYLLWELLFLYDGYFYKPVSFIMDGEKTEPKMLVRTAFYITDKQWYESELLGRAARNLSAEILEKYATFRNMGMADKKMTKSVVNAFYYLHSEAYKEINSNHRLSLLLNIADGFVINTFKDTNNVKANLERMFKNIVNAQKVKKGIALLGMPDEQFKYNLAEERKVFDHYVYSEGSIAAFVSNSTDKKRYFITWFFIYVMELVIRLNFLKEIGVEIEQCIRDYSIDAIVDWVIFENNIDEDCITWGYQMRQLERRIRN